jgi:hypothetical protein
MYAEKTDRMNRTGGKTTPWHVQILGKSGDKPKIHWRVKKLAFNKEHSSCGLTVLEMAVDIPSLGSQV